MLSDAVRALVTFVAVMLASVGMWYLMIQLPDLQRTPFNCVRLALFVSVIVLLLVIAATY